VSRGAIDAPFAVDFVHRVRFTRDLFDPANPTLADALDPERRGRGPARLLLAIDRGVHAAWPDIEARVTAYAAAHRERMPPPAATLSVVGGEAAKNDMATVDATMEAIDLQRICRQSFVLAIGGGAMLDAVGFAAATAHRGVRLVRVPTTTLAQDDAAMGVKNGVNRRGKKNFVGAFATPWAVLNDERFLETLPDDHFRDGFSEAVKIALLRDPALFRRMEDTADAIRARDLGAAMPVVRRSAELHLRHIVRGGDPFELREARPLDYGHWSAHRIESLTHFAVSHGAAVGIGVALDTLYAALDGRLPRHEAERTIALLQRLGIACWHPVLDNADALLAGLEEFREHLGGRLTVTLLTGIGQPEDAHALAASTVRAAIAELGTMTRKDSSGGRRAAP
jgi:3-dehydroquinate synthase